MLLLILCLLSFFLGVGLGTATDFSLPSWLWFLPCVFLLFREWKLACLVLVFLLGCWRVTLYEAQAPDFQLGWQQLEGVIVEEVDKRQDHQKITVQTPQGRLLVRLSLYEDLAYGDRVSVWGAVEPPSEDIDGFSYANYLARYRIWQLIYDGGVKVLEPASPSLRGTLYEFKGQVEARLNRLFMEPESSFAAGLLLGSRKGMPQVLTDAFQVTGLTHIVAISGYNITLIIVLMFALFGFLPMKTRIVVSSIAIAVFVVLVGASAAVVRAGIMGVLTLWGLFTGRRSQVFFALLWSAFFMVLANPYILLYDVGFQLSFASTLGLLIYAPFLERIPWGKGIPVLREALLLTLAAQIATLPFMGLHFGQVSLIAPLANLLVAPFLPLAMLFSALAVLLKQPFVLLAWFFLWVVEQTALLLAKLPWIQVRFQLSVLEFFLLCAALLWPVLRLYKSTLVRAFLREHEGVFSTLFCREWRKREK